jgi:hypothetical protein
MQSGFTASEIVKQYKWVSRRLTSILETCIPSSLTAEAGKEGAQAASAGAVWRFCLDITSNFLT